MKLSEAIRLGAMMKPQAFGRVSGEKTCALGAALDAVGCVPTNGYWGEVFSIWPISTHKTLYPGDAYRNNEHFRDDPIMVGSLCWILNDADHWSREQIADWVASIEAAQESKSAESTPVPVTVPA